MSSYTSETKYVIPAQLPHLPSHTHPATPTYTQSVDKHIILHFVYIHVYYIHLCTRMQHQASSPVLLRWLLVDSLFFLVTGGCGVLRGDLMLPDTTPAPLTSRGEGMEGGSRLRGTLSSSLSSAVCGGCTSPCLSPSISLKGFLMAVGLSSDIAICLTFLFFCVIKCRRVKKKAAECNYMYT